MDAISHADLGFGNQLSRRVRRVQRAFRMQDTFSISALTIVSDAKHIQSIKRIRMGKWLHANGYAPRAATWIQGCKDANTAPAAHTMRNHIQ
jgi:hypothetical protein